MENKIIFDVNDIICKMQHEIAAMVNEYEHRDTPIKEDHYFNIEYHMGRYHMLREILDTYDSRLATFINDNYEELMEKLHKFIDDFTTDVHRIYNN